MALVEDDVRLRSLLTEYLGRQPEFNCVVVAGSVEELLEELDLSLPPQVILLDIGLPGMSGLDALPIIKRRLPDVEIIVQTVFDDVDRLYQALRTSASGYLLKSSPLPEYKFAVLDVMRGGAPMSRAVARKVLAHFKPVPSLDADALTDRERDVLTCLADGLGEKQVASTWPPAQCTPTSRAFTRNFGSAAGANCWGAPRGASCKTGNRTRYLAALPPTSARPAWPGGYR